jgi:hypothetical protein
MALELLAGPFPVVAGDGVTAVDISEARFYPQAIYDDANAIVSYANPGAIGSLTITQMDGVTYNRAAISHAQNFVLDLQTPNGWLAVDSLFMDAVHAFDLTTGAVGDLILSGGTADMADVQVRAADRWLTISNAIVGARALALTTGSFATEFTLIGAGTGRASVSRTRKDGVLCVAWPTGEVLFYDCIARVQVPGLAAFVGANYGAWYSALHDVFVVLTGTSTNAVSIYANAVLPTAISNPVASPALALGRMSTLSVTLTGANGEPSAGELVDWALAGPGNLMATQSESDENGVARVGYVAPLALSTDPTFTATVTL